MNVAVKPAVERTERRAHQDERLCDLSSLQESVQVIHHPGRQQQSSVPAQKKKKKNKSMHQNGGQMSDVFS